MRHILLCIVWIVLNAGTAQFAMAGTESFDIMQFDAPRGIRAQQNEYLGFTDVRGQSFAQYAIFRSAQGSGNTAQDFQSEWVLLVEKQYQVQGAPQTETLNHGNGWSVTLGAAQANSATTGTFITLLAVFSAQNTKMSVLVNYNDNNLRPAIDAFMNSLKPNKPETSQSDIDNVTISVSTPGSGPVSNGLSATTFDDGWMAQAMSDYVQLKKGAVTVLLHYPVEITSQIRGRVSEAMWNQLVVSRYNLSNVRYFEDSPCYNCIYFYQADGLDKESGKRVSIAFRVIVETGIAYCIEIIAPSEAEIMRELPNHEKIASMLNYNKFKVTAAELAGAWSESTHSAVNMYNTVTGAYAGMNMTAGNSSFEFGKDGKYQSRHVGAYGMAGSSTVYDNKYNGQYLLNNWEIGLTNRYGGKTEEFYAQFEAVRGGKILYLVNKQASGIRYRLAKTK